jgi:hypothetical protein
MCHSRSRGTIIFRAHLFSLGKPICVDLHV